MLFSLVHGMETMHLKAGMAHPVKRNSQFGSAIKSTLLEQ